MNTQSFDGSFWVHLEFKQIQIFHFHSNSSVFTKVWVAEFRAAREVIYPATEIIYFCCDDV